MGVFDFLWLGVIAKNLYAEKIGHLMAENPNWTAAILFYLLYALAVTFFLVTPFVSGELTLMELVTRAAFFGVVAYGTYDLTNWATLKDWPVDVVVIDMIWGAFFTSISAVIAGYISKIFI